MADEIHWSLPWRERSVEEARIFNPAFCSELISRTVGKFHRSKQEALNLAIAFIVLPLTLHGPTRETLPKTTNKMFAGWVLDNAALLAELPSRVKHLKPVSREALLFAVSHRVIAFTATGLVPGTRPIRIDSKPSVSTDEVGEIRSAADLLGRWFAAQWTQTSILQGMGVVP